MLLIKKPFILLICVTVLVTMVKIMSIPQKAPVVSVDLRVTETTENSCTIYWGVQNKSDYDIHFQKGTIAICKVDGNNYELRGSGAVTKLNPQEKYEAQYTVKNLSKGYHTISLIAECKENTTANYQTTVKIE